MARRRSGEQYLRTYLGDGYSSLDKNGKLVKGNNVLNQKSVRDQLKDVNTENGKRENRRVTQQEAFRASDPIKKGRNILKSSTNDPGEKVMGAGSKPTPPVKKNSSKKRNAPKSKSAAKRSIRKK